MLFNQMTYIGIDPTAGKHPISYAALDGDLKLLALGQGDIDEVIAYTAGQQQAIVAVCSPRRPNQGFMKLEEFREKLSPAPAPGRWLNFRLVEFLLRQHNLHIPRTPGGDEDIPNWMKVGFIIFERIAEIGYTCESLQNSDRISIEVYPHASFTVLLGMTPFNKLTLEGRLQRQLVLFEANIQIPDPMRVFEEITRFRLLKGILPLDDLFSPSKLDALAGAYTAWFSINQPSETTLIGDPLEGQIVLPVKEMKQRYH
jgi:hypothetical protein